MMMQPTPREGSWNAIPLILKESVCSAKHFIMTLLNTSVQYSDLVTISTYRLQDQEKAWRGSKGRRVEGGE